MASALVERTKDGNSFFQGDRDLLHPGALHLFDGSFGNFAAFLDEQFVVVTADVARAASLGSPAFIGVAPFGSAGTAVEVVDAILGSAGVSEGD